MNATARTNATSAKATTRVTCTERDAGLEIKDVG